MPDVQEVFRLATQKVRPDPGTLERQHRAQRRSAIRRRAGVYSLVAALAIIGAVLALTLPRDESAPPIPGDSLAPTDPLPGNYILSISTGALTPLSIADGTEFDVSADGSRVAYTADVSGHPQIWISNLDGTDAHAVTRDPLGAEFASWSPDGRQLAYAGFGAASSDRSVFVVDLTTGRSTKITDEPVDVWRMDWSPDGQQILYSVAIAGTPDTTGTGAGAIFQLRTVDVVTGEVDKIAGDRDALASEGTWSPDGTSIAYNQGIDSPTQLGFDPAEIWTMDTDGGNPQLLLAVPQPAIGADWSRDGTSIAYTVAAGDATTIHIVDADSGADTFVGVGAFPTWVDADRLIVEVI